MTPSSLDKKTKKSSLKTKTPSKISTPTLESSSSPSKSLKRKKETETLTTTVNDDQKPTKIAKKHKKDDTSKPAEPVIAETKKKSKIATQSGATKIAVVEPADNAPKSKSKAKDSSTSLPASTVLPKSILKKSKPIKPIPTSISRPRNNTEASKSKKPQVVSEPEEDEEEEEKEGEDEAEAVNEDTDSEKHLHGFSTDDDDSSDEEDAMDDEPSEFDLGKLPTIAKDDATVKRKLEKAKQHPTDSRGVLFLGRLPHGFYEDQLKAYFSQFGNVTRLRISRNKKTGRSKHYGFIEFDSSTVAQIVAETMDNYLLMGHILRCKVIPNDQVHPELWVGANRKWRVVPADRVARVEHNKPRTESEQTRAAKRLLKRQQERKKKLEKAGIKYNFDAVGYKPATGKV